MRPSATPSRDIKENKMNEEQALRQGMLQPDPLIHPNMPMLDKTHSQVTSESIQSPDDNNQSQISPQKESMDTNAITDTPKTLPGPGPQPVQPMTKLTPCKILFGPASDAKRDLAWEGKNALEKEKPESSLQPTLCVPDQIVSQRSKTTNKEWTEAKSNQ